MQENNSDLNEVKNLNKVKKTSPAEAEKQSHDSREENSEFTEGKRGV